MSAPEPQVRVEEVRPGWWEVRCDSCGHSSGLSPDPEASESGAEHHRRHCPDLRLARLQARWDARDKALRALIERWRDRSVQDGMCIHEHAEVMRCADELERAIGGGR